jgi:hypothetical protein
MTKMSKNSKRYECAVLLRDAAWALKRYADRIERCCTENPNDDNEKKATIWFDRAKERLAKFTKSRREYLGIVSSKVFSFTEDFDQFFARIIKEWGNVATITGRSPLTGRKVYPVEMPDGTFGQRVIERNPWRAGPPPMTAGRVAMLMSFVDFDVDESRIVFDDANRFYASRADAWRPA